MLGGGGRWWRPTAGNGEDSGTGQLAATGEEREGEGEREGVSLGGLVSAVNTF